MANSLLDKIADLSSDMIFADLGIMIKKVITEMGEDLLDGQFHDAGTFPINPSMCGPLAPMFEMINVEVKVGVSVRAIHLQYEYKYFHTGGGSNGFTARKEIELPTVLRRAREKSVKCKACGEDVTGRTVNAEGFCRPCVNEINAAEAAE